nr:unnamed protein product [Callosobruchus analis]
MPYADLVRGIWKDVNLKSVDVELSSVRKTQKGDFSWKEHMQSGELNKQCCISKDWTATSKDEIEDALREAVGDKADRCRDTSLRPAFGESQNATVIADAEVAQQILKMGSLPIGLVHCQITEKERSSKDWCYKCWHKGHDSRTCKGPYRASLRYKCAQPGHISKNCINEPFCPSCNREGHQMGRTSCTGS